jgi:hypothetical protein
MSWKGYHVWNIIEKETGRGMLCAFLSRKECVDWLNLMKEQHFFETGSMEDAEEKWRLDKFTFEQSLLLRRETVMEHFPLVDLNNWDYDI